MLKNKVLNLGLSFLIAITVTFAILCGTIFRNDIKLETRNVEITQFNYGQSVQNILDMFSDTSNDMDGFNASFEGSLKLDTKNYNIDFLASGINEVTTKYSTNYDLTDNLFYVTTSIYAEDILIEQTKESYTPQYDETTDDVYFEIDGTRLTIKELLGETKEECLAWFLPMLIPVIASLFVVATAPVVLNPSFYQPVADTIDRGARNIWDWFRSLFTPKPTTVEKYITLTKTQLEQVKQVPSNNKVYQIAFVNDSGQLQVSAVYLNWLESIALLHSVKPLNEMLNSVDGLREKVLGVNVGSLGEQAKVDANTLKNKSNIGIYTKNVIDAGKLAYAVGARENESGEFKAETHNTKVGSKYFYHFHDGAHTIHIWYGNPI